MSILCQEPLVLQPLTPWECDLVAYKYVVTGDQAFKYFLSKNIPVGL